MSNIVIAKISRFMTWLATGILVIGMLVAVGILILPRSIHEFHVDYGPLRVLIYGVITVSYVIGLILTIIKCPDVFDEPIKIDTYYDENKTRIWLNGLIQFGRNIGRLILYTFGFIVVSMIFGFLMVWIYCIWWLIVLGIVIFLSLWAARLL